MHEMSRNDINEINNCIQEVSRDEMMKIKNYMKKMTQRILEEVKCNKK